MIRNPPNRISSNCRQTNHLRRRRGSLYISVVMVASLVSVLGLSAILVSRINRQSHESLADVASANLHAQSALRLGLLRIEEDPNWRFNRSGSEWAVDVPVGNGTYSLSVVDPSDNDLSDAAADPIVLIGTGRQGNAIRKHQITLAPLYRGYDCLQSAVHAADDVIFDDAYVSSDGQISANDDVGSNNSWIVADVEATDDVHGSQFMRAIDEGTDLRSVPDKETVLKFYLENGTYIDSDDLPTQFSSILRNGDFEDGDTEWVAKSCTITAQSEITAQGSSALLMTGRDRKTDGVEQDVTSLLASGRNLDLTAYLRSSDANAVYYAHLIVSSTYHTLEFNSGPISLADADTWTHAEVSVTPWWWGTLTSARLVIDTSPSSLYGGFYFLYSGSTDDFLIDDLQLRESENVRNIDQALLSPVSNPFGETNPDGIYILDMKGRRVVIRNSRIHGTLVLLDPNNNSELGDDCALFMSPAVQEFPALVVANGQVYLNPSSRGLSESALELNLNPPGAPHTSIGSDNDQDDVFASGIDGLIYSSENLRLRNHNQIHGCIVSAKDVDIEDHLSLTYDSRYYRNPPPGFNGPEQIRILLGSARRTVAP